MKKFVLAFTLMATSFLGFSQEVRLNLYSGYVFDDAVDSRYDAYNYYAGTVKGAYQWGASMDFMAANNTSIELSYQRMNTLVPLNYYKVGPQSTTFNLAMNHMMVGVNRFYKSQGSMAEFYTGAQIGLLAMGWKNPNNYNTGTIEKFAWGLKAGLNIWPAKNIGIKIQGQMQSAVQSIGGGLYMGYGGPSVGLTTASTLYQFGLGGGLIFRFPQTK